MKIEVLKRNNEWVVEFSFGNQFFTLQYGGTKAEAQWMARMLTKCCTNYTSTIRKEELGDVMHGGANSLLRTTYQIAQRNGERTNWIAFRKRLTAELKRQHKIMYPKK